MKFVHSICICFLISICGIINETITAPSIDILYYQIQRKWQQFVLRSTTSTGEIEL